MSRPRGVTFFMYLKQLYQYHKGWFVLLLLFAIIQLTLDIRQDASISPFFHYGMYSKKVQPGKIYIVPAIEVNGERLQPAHFSPQQWDNISLPVMLYENEHAWNSQLWHQHISRLLCVKDSLLYINSLRETGFRQWYQSYLATQLRQDISSVKIYQDIYIYQNRKFNQQHSAQ